MYMVIKFNANLVHLLNYHSIPNSSILLVANSFIHSLTHSLTHYLLSAPMHKALGMQQWVIMTQCLT